MIRIRYIHNSEAIESYYNEIVKDRQRRKIRELDKWCEQNLSGRCFKDIVCANPEELIDIKNEIDDLVATCRESIWDGICSIDNKGHRKSYVVDTLYKSHTSPNRFFRQILVEELDIQVCPYCNRNYIFSDRKINSCELDHFYSKRQYPILAVSFYNLIPCCSTCNRNKSDQELKYFPHMQSENTDDIVKFGYDIADAAFISNPSAIRIKMKALNPEYEYQMKAVLKLPQLYEHNIGLVRDIAIKKYIFSDKYVDSLITEFENLGLSPEKVNSILYQARLTEEDYGKMPYSKLIHDIIWEDE